MKRIIAIVMVCCMLMMFSACGDKEKDAKSATTTKVSETTKASSKKSDKKEDASETTTKDDASNKKDSSSGSNSSSSGGSDSSGSGASQGSSSNDATTTTTTTKKATASNVISNGLMSSFSTYDMNGNVVNQSILSGKKVTMFNVWWTGCSPCINEMPDLATLNAKYSNFQVIGIVYDYTNTSSVNSIISQTGANYTHIWLDSGIYSKVQTAGYQGYVPFTFFVDENGNQLKFTCNGQVVSSTAGAWDWEPIIQELLAA